MAACVYATSCNTTTVLGVSTCVLRVEGASNAITHKDPGEIDLITGCDAVAVTVAEYLSINRENPIEPIHPEIAIEDSVAFFGLAFVFIAAIWATKKIYEIFTRDNT